LPYGQPVTIAPDANGSSGGAVLDMNSHSQTIGPLATTASIGGTGNNIPTVKLTGALTVLETNSTTFAGLISGSGGSLTVNGNSVLTLSGTNTYTGPTTVSAGTLEIAAPNQGLASTIVNVASGATLQLDSPTALNAQVALLLAAGSPVVNLNHGGTNQIRLLSFDGGKTFATAGTWGSSTSPAQHQDARFTSGGVLAVQLAGSQTNAILGITNKGTNSFTLNLQGTPQVQYYLVFQTNVSQPFSKWQPVPGSTNTAPGPDGRWSFVASNAGPVFYRSVALNPAL
jgi:autotransporter-associated beta strand protein